jgi:hypothetical protein
MAVELFQFAGSHYNEKARWVLDYKGIPHVRHTLLPGPHRLTAMRLSGQPMVPFLRYDGKVVAGSGAIIDALESAHPTPPLYPVDPQLRARALDVQRWFDDQIGPEVRRAKFFDILDDAPYVASIFSRGKDAVSRGAYRAAFPMLGIAMRRGMRGSPPRPRPSRAITRAPGSISSSKRPDRTAISSATPSASPTWRRPPCWLSPHGCRGRRWRRRSRMPRWKSAGWRAGPITPGSNGLSAPTRSIAAPRAKCHGRDPHAHEARFECASALSIQPYLSDVECIIYSDLGRVTAGARAISAYEEQRRRSQLEDDNQARRLSTRT